MKRKIIAFVAIVVALTTLVSFSAAATENAIAGKWNYDTNIHAPDMSEVAYSFALVGDTQILTASDANTAYSFSKDPKYTDPESPDYDPNAIGSIPVPIAEEHRNQNYVKNLYSWIVQQKEEKKIAYVFGLGDITQNHAWTGSKATPSHIEKANLQVSFVDPEWNVAKEAIFQLDAAGIPYSQVRGNHDNKEKFLETFNTPYYTSQFEGTYKDLNNTYRTFDICGEKYLFMTLDYAPTTDILDWAASIIQQYPDRKVIVSTHGYMDNDAQNKHLLSHGTNYVQNGSSDSGYDGNIGSQMWSLLFRKYENIFMVICGHFGTDCPQIVEAKGTKGNTVYQVLVNPQDYDSQVTLTGAVAMLYFSADGSTFWIEYYSTILDKYYDLTPDPDGKHEQFTNYKVVYSSPRFSTTIATTATPTTATSTTAMPTTAGATTAPEATTAPTSSGCNNTVFFGGAFMALPVIAGCSAVAVSKKKKNK